MSSAAAEVSLHCVICFEEFSLHERPPVVLPCGHTYVCIVCAKRLKKCMECREPLFWTPPHPKGPLPTLNMNTRSPAPRYAPRGRYSPGPQTPPHPSYSAPPPHKEEPVPLPLPKNTVLMDMIESAERQNRLLEQSKNEPVDKYESHENKDDDESTSLLNPTLAGMSAFVGACGTYAVRESLGLAVLPFDPNKQHQTEEKKAELVEEKKAEEPKEPFTIQEGQTVQVVGVDEGVYQLARGAGFIVATVNQLVKGTISGVLISHNFMTSANIFSCAVGGPIEKSCRLEGMLRSVSREQEELQKKLDEINRLANGLKDQINFEQEQPESHPVISPLHPPEPAQGANDENDAQAATGNPSTPPGVAKTDSLSPVIGMHLTASTDSTEVELGNPRTPARDHQDPKVMLHSPAHSCPMPNDTRLAQLDQPFIDGQSAGLPRYRVNSDDDLHGLHGLTWGFGCGTTLFGERLIEADSDNGNIMTLSFDDFVDDNATIGAHSRGAATLHTVAGGEGQNAESPLRSGSFDGVNFRTGMSGHRGLNQSRARNSPLTRTNFRMMSEHRGIGTTRISPHLQRRTPHTDTVGNIS